MTYPGGKNSCYQKIINLIPPHRIYVEPFLGSGAIMRYKRPAEVNIGGDLDPNALDLFRALAPDELLRDVTVMERDAFETISLYEDDSDTFIYIDSPYLFEARSSNRELYDFEMGNPEQHEELLQLILRCNCMVMISGYWSEMYADMLGSWRTFSFQAQTRGGGTATEWLWMNYPAPERLHDYRYLGRNFTQRQQIKRKKDRHVRKFLNMDPLERAALFWGLEEAGLI